MNNKVRIQYGTSITEARQEAERNYRNAKAVFRPVPDYAKVGFLDDHLVSVIYEDFSTSTGNPMWGYQITHPKSESHLNGATTVQHKYATIHDALEGAENYYNNHLLPEIISTMKKVDDKFQVAIVGKAGTGLQVLTHILHSSLQSLKFQELVYKEPERTPEFSKEVANFLRSTPKIEIVEIPQKADGTGLKSEKNSLYGEFHPDSGVDLQVSRKVSYDMKPIPGVNCLDADQAVKAYTSPEYRSKIGRIGTDQPVINHEMPSSHLNREKVNFITKEDMDFKARRPGMFNITVRGYLDSSSDSPIVEYIADVVPNKGDVINVGEKRYKVIEREFNVMQSHKVTLTVTKS